MPACLECNNGTSTADLVVSIVSRWGEHESQTPDHGKLVARLRKQAPEVLAEWTSSSLMGRIKGRRHLERSGAPVPPGAGIITVGEATITQLNIFAHKATLALYFEHFRRVLPINGAFCADWRSKEDYAKNGLPTQLLGLLPNYATLVQGTWNESETFEYRHAINIERGLFGFFARFRYGLFVSGFTVDDASQLPADEPDWLKPIDLLSLLNNPRYKERQ